MNKCKGGKGKIDFLRFVNLGLIVVAVILALAIAKILLIPKVEKPPEKIPPIELPPEEVPPERVVPPPVEAKEIFIYSNYYEPNFVAVKAGEKVRWINRDMRIRILVSEVFAKTMLPGENFSWAFWKVGEFLFWDEDLGKGVNGTIRVLK